MPRGAAELAAPSWFSFESTLPVLPRRAGVSEPMATVASSSTATPGQFLRGYAVESRRPLASLLLMLPVLAVYELGVLLVPTAARNGADVWLRQWLDLAGFSGYFLLPLLTLAILVACHHASHQPWRLSAGVLYGMCGECLLWAMALAAAARVQMWILHSGVPLAAQWPASMDGLSTLAGRLVTFFGAGVYEELLFRLLLLSALHWMLAAWTTAPRARWAGAIVLSSLAFAAAHYLGAHGDAWQWSTFLFRATAGGFFAVLYVYRGFGIAAGTHTMYDVLVGLRMI